MVSIIIPAYNHRDYILGTIGSVLTQTFLDFEIIVVNDGSPDDTRDVLRPYISDGRIHYIEQSNAGQAAARNHGLSESRGEFVAFLDDDDLWPREKLQTQMDLLNSHPTAVMAYGYTEVFGCGPTHRWPGPDAPTGEVRSEFLRCNWLWSPGQCLIRRAALLSIGGLDTGIWGADDWDMYIRLASLGPFVFSNHCALQYRQHAKSASNSIFRLNKNVRKVMRKHLGLLPSFGTSELWFSARKSWADGFRPKVLYGSDELTRTGRHADALRYLLEGAKLEPSLFIRPAFLRRTLNLLRILAASHRDTV